MALLVLYLERMLEYMVIATLLTPIGEIMWANFRDIRLGSLTSQAWKNPPYCHFPTSLEIVGTTHISENHIKPYKYSFLQRLVLQMKVLRWYYPVVVLTVRRRAAMES